MAKFHTTVFAAGITTFLLAPQVHAQALSDVRGYWGEQYITTLVNRSIIGGFPDGTFRPNADITRAQFAAIAVKAFNLPVSGVSNNFTDVRSNYWANPAITAVSNSGLVTGFPDGTFRPDDRITRAQAMVVLAKALGNRFRPSGSLDNYSDRQAIPDWANESITKAANAGVIVNFPDPRLIAPNRLATRGEVAGLIYQTLFKLGDRGLPEITIGTIDSSPNTPVVTNLFIDRIEANSNIRGAGDDLVVTAYGSPQATASFSLDGINRDRPIPMAEIQPGVYEGTYTIRRNDQQTNGRLTVTLNKQGASPVNRTLNQAIAINSNTENTRTLTPRIINTSNNELISLPFNLAGETLPNARVRITVEALRSVAGIISVSQNLLETTVNANRQGRFNIDLPQANRNTQLRIRMTASRNNQSQSSEILLRSR